VAETGLPYAYTGDDPVNDVDPMGLKTKRLTKAQQKKEAERAVNDYINAGPAIARNTAHSSLFGDFVWIDNHRGPLMIGANAVSIGLTLGAAAPLDASLDAGADSAVDATVRPSSPYVRPTGATTAAQRASVQGLPCVDCGAIADTQVADHINPLVQEWYETGTIDQGFMHSLDAVQPQCPACSAAQGGRLSWYSRGMNNQLFGGGNGRFDLSGCPDSGL
jgi:hypothetical protein